jgi:hypothetical protein
MNDVNLNLDLGVDKIIAELTGNLVKYQENKTYNKVTYDELLEKYSRAIETIKLLGDEINKLKNGELTKDKIETLEAGLNFLENLDESKITNLMKLSEKFGSKK